MINRNVILFAEDHDGVRDVCQMMLQRDFQDSIVETFVDGSSLERKLNDGIGNVKLVIIDDNIPGITGSQIIKNYSRREEFKHIPFILLYGGDELIGQIAVENGAFAYLLKPAKREDLFATVRRALDYSSSQPTASLQ